MTKSPIDLMRESGGAFKIESNGDDTPIQEMCTLNDRLVLVTKKAIYEIKLADQVDPKRENSNLPHNVQRRVLDTGSDSALVGQTLLTANVLFKQKFLPSFVNIHTAMSLVFEALLDLVAMNIASEEFVEIEEKQIQTMENRSQTNGSFAIPSISDIGQRAKSFIQKANHVEEAIIDMISIFYPDISSAGHFETIVNHLETKYDINDDFVKFLKDILPFMKMVRNMRNCLDHRKVKGAQVLNFRMNPDSTISLPTIEINFRGITLDATSLSFFMSNTTKYMTNVIGDLIAFVCSKHVQTFGDAPIQVGLVPENKRRNKFIRFSYYTNITGQWMPIN